MKNIILHTVDAFSDQPFCGNPAAVALVEENLSTAFMQNVALEMNLSETAFLWRLAPAQYKIRWFTPHKEVDLCGHATLASAHWLWESGSESADQIRFVCQSGELSAARRENGQICLDFPQEPPVQDLELAAVLTEILGTKVLWAGKNRMDFMAEIADEDALLTLSPNMAQMAALPCRGVLVTTRSSDRQFDFKSRTFFPGLGVPEDPVCGSAHCCFAPYWSQKLGKQEMLAYQASERGGVLRITVKGDRVELLGTAITTTRIELLVPPSL